MYSCRGKAALYSRLPIRLFFRTITSTTVPPSKSCVHSISDWFNTDNLVLCCVFASRVAATTNSSFLSSGIFLCLVYIYIYIYQLIISLWLADLSVVCWWIVDSFDSIRLGLLLLLLLRFLPFSRCVVVHASNGAARSRRGDPDQSWVWDGLSWLLGPRGVGRERRWRPLATLRLHGRHDRRPVRPYVGVSHRRVYVAFSSGETPPVVVDVPRLSARRKKGGARVPVGCFGILFSDLCVVRFVEPPTDGVATTSSEGLRSVGTRRIQNNNSYLFLFSNCRHVLCALESYRSLVSGSSDRLVLVVRRDPAERLRTKNRKYQKKKKKKHSHQSHSSSFSFVPFRHEMTEWRNSWHSRPACTN